MFTLSCHSGMGRFACELVRGARDVRGPGVTLIAPEMEHEPGGGVRIPLRDASFHPNRFVRLFNLLAMTFEAALHAWRQARPGSVFVMICLHLTVPLSVLPAIAARLRGARTVLNMHDFYPHAPRYPRALRRLELLFYRMSYRRFDLIAAMKEAQIPRLVDEAGVPRERIVIIEHGAFPVEGLVHPEDGSPACRLLILGSLRANKKVVECIEAIKRIRAAHPEVLLRMAGAPRPEEKEYWAQCRAALAGMEGVEIIDRYIADEEMPGVLSDVDGFLCPYEGFDSQSGVSIVAVSNGIPLIATRAAWVGALEPTMEIATPVTVESIEAAVKRFLAIPRRERLAQASEAKARFDDQSHWKQAIRIIMQGIQPFLPR